MSDFIKTKLKALKVSVQAKDWPAVEKNAKSAAHLSPSTRSEQLTPNLALQRRSEFREQQLQLVSTYLTACNSTADLCATGGSFWRSRCSTSSDSTRPRRSIRRASRMHLHSLSHDK